MSPEGAQVELYRERCVSKVLKFVVGGRGLHSLTSKLNLRTFSNTSRTLELNLSTLEHIHGLVWVV